MTPKKLTKSEEQVLKKGLTFCPSTGLNYAQTRIDLFRFSRKLRLFKFFKIKGHPEKHIDTSSESIGSASIHGTLTGEDLDLLQILSSQEIQSTGSVPNVQQIEGFGIQQKPAKTSFQPQSTFSPTTTCDAIDIFEETIVRDLQRHRMGSKIKYQANLTKAQRNAIIQIQQDSSIICKPSDKGGNVVLLTREYSIKEAQRQLSDLKNYQPISKEQYSRSITSYHDLLTKWFDRGMLSDKEHTF